MRATYILLGLLPMAQAAFGATGWKISGGDVVVRGGQVVVPGTTALAASGAGLTVDGGRWSTGAFSGLPSTSLRLSNADGAIEALEITGGAAAGVTTFDGTVTDAANGAGGLLVGGGTSLTLTAANSYTGVTAVEGATLVANNSSGSATGAGSVVIMHGATLTGSGRVDGGVLIESGARIAPAPLLDFGGALVVEGTLALQLAMGSNDALTAAGWLDIGSATLELNAMDLSAGSHVLASYGGLTGGAFGRVLGLPDGYRLDYAYHDGGSANHIALVTAGAGAAAYDDWATAAGLTAGVNDAFDADPNCDGVPNGLHFAFGSDPLAAGPVVSPIRVDLLDDGGATYLTLTLPVRAGATFDGFRSELVDGIEYEFFGSRDLALDELAVVERALAFNPAALPAVGSDWEYRSFRLTTPSHPASLPEAFIGVRVYQDATETTVDSATYGGLVADVPAGSDTYLGVPLRVAAAAYDGEVESVTPVSGGLQLALTGVDGFLPGVFAGGYFARFTSGAHAGEYFTVTANTAGAVTIDDLGLDLSAVTAGDRVRLVEYPTLGSLLPPSTQQTLTLSAGNFPTQRKSELLFPNLDGAGVKRSAARIFFVTAGGWRESTSGFPNANAVPIQPDQFIILRQPATGGGLMKTVGVVETGPMASLVFTEAAQDNDTYLAQARPVPVRLDQLGLDTVFTASAGNFPGQRKDELLLWDNALQAQKKSPSRIFFRVGTQWRETISGFPARNDFELPAGSAFILRKRATVAPTVTVWSQSPGLGGSP